MITRPLVLVALVASLGLAAAATAKLLPRHEGAPAAPVAEEQALADGASLYDLDLPLTDAAGHARRLSDLRGTPYVASMIYTHCTSVCPRVTADLQNLERHLPAAARAHERFVLFSLDPQRDTPAALRAFAAQHNLDPARWTLFAVDADGMRTLAAVLGVRHRQEAGGVIAHTAAFAVVDKGGVVRYRQLGLAESDAPLVAAVLATQR